jgi:hypothetical protein
LPRRRLQDECTLHVCGGGGWLRRAVFCSCTSLFANVFSTVAGYISKHSAVGLLADRPPAPKVGDKTSL